MEKENFTYKGNINAFVKVKSQEGLLGFYRGYKASLSGVIVYHGFSFFIFSTLKELVRERSPENYKKWYVDFTLGGLSALGQVFAYPLDILRKRMQGQFLLLEKKEISHLRNYK